MRDLTYSASQWRKALKKNKSVEYSIFSDNIVRKKRLIAAALILLGGKDESITLSETSAECGKFHLNYISSLGVTWVETARDKTSLVTFKLKVTDSGWFPTEELDRFIQELV